MQSRILTLAITSLLSVSAMATNSSQGDHHDTTAISGSASKSNAISGSKSSANAGAAAVSGSVATGGAGGNAEQTATGGNAEQSLANTNTLSNSSTVAANGGNVGDTTTGNQSISVQEARQTPWVILPSIFANDCGSGFNAGGSKVGGAGAFGFTWTTDKCYDFKNGTNFVAIGAIEEACVLWVDVNRKAFKRQKYTPDCRAIAQRVYAGMEKTATAEATQPSAPDLSGYVKREELAPLAPKVYVDEKVGRVFKQSMSK